MKQSFLFYLLFWTLVVQSQSSNDTIKNLSASVKQLNTQNDVCNDEIKKLRLDIKSLTDRLSEVDQTLPSSIQPGTMAILDDKIFAEFRLNKRGFIKVKIFRNQNSQTPDLEISSNYEQNPVVILQPLAANTEYFIVAIVVDYTGKETRSIASFKNFDQLKVKTKTKLQKPTVDFQSPQISNDAITIPLTVDSKVNYSYSYQRIERKNDQRIGISEGGYNSSLEPNKFGQVDNVLQVSEIKIANLQANTEYDFRFTFYDTSGQVTDVYRTYTTSNKPLELNFVDGVKINYNILKSTVSWKTNKKPSEAYINFQTSDGQTHIQTIAKVSNDSCYVELDFEKFKGLLGLASSKKGNSIPQINVVMKDEKGNEKKMAFKVSISVPTEKDIKAANNIDEKKKKEMIESTEEVRDYLSGSSHGGKIKWEKLIKVGVPIILGLL